MQIKPNFNQQFDIHHDIFLGGGGVKKLYIILIYAPVYTINIGKLQRYRDQKICACGNITFSCLILYCNCQFLSICNSMVCVKMYILRNTSGFAQIKQKNICAKITQTLRKNYSQFVETIPAGSTTPNVGKYFSKTIFIFCF